MSSLLEYENRIGVCNADRATWMSSAKRTISKVWLVRACRFSEGFFLFALDFYILVDFCISCFVMSSGSIRLYFRSSGRCLGQGDLREQEVQLVLLLLLMFWAYSSNMRIRELQITGSSEPLKFLYLDGIGTSGMSQCGTKMWLQVAALMKELLCPILFRTRLIDNAWRHNQRRAICESLDIAHREVLAACSKLKQSLKLKEEALSRHNALIILLNEIKRGWTQPLMDLAMGSYFDFKKEIFRWRDFWARDEHKGGALDCNFQVVQALYQVALEEDQGRATKEVGLLLNPANDGVV
ncbi:uncharacterized protein G2W53_001573 [Senna tora]|uniref:Uncharacterized protein n=1 Tax=Senna tora TaxID=362788 RepID=A0A834XHG0_9FABA|nr:uncharacterized protein G2W53_001573 [Senna tora]